MIITFYSYKGGVGRTMALANIAQLFYQNGLKVLIIDWDLEAPGLDRFFFSGEAFEDVLDKPGLIDMLIDYKNKVSKQSIESETETEKDLPFDNLESYLIEVYPERNEKGKMWFLPAGKRSNENFEEYANKVLTFNWKDFYQNWEGELYFEWLRQQFEKKADVILIDSRTGITEIGGICTYQLADTIVLLCATNQQNIDGTYGMVKNFSSKELQRMRPDRPINILIVPTRTENIESEKLDDFKRQFNAKFSGFISDKTLRNTENVWKLRIPYVPKYSYNETIAIKEQYEASAEEISEAYEKLYKILANKNDEQLGTNHQYFSNEIFFEPKEFSVYHERKDTINILHFSDIHFMKKKDGGHRYFQDMVQKRLLEAVEKHVEVHPAPEFVTITGDIAFAGKNEEYENSLAFFQQLRQIVPDAVFLPVPGNHDVDRDKVKKLFSLYDIVRKNETDAFLNSREYISHFVNSKFTAFRAFSEVLQPGLYVTPDDYYWVKKIEDRNIAFLGLNSAWACQGDEDRFQIALGFPQLKNALEKSADMHHKILLMHHSPFNWLRDFEYGSSRSETFKKCSLILCGHIHADRAFIHQDPSYSCICLSANVSCTEENGGFIGFQFLEVEFIGDENKIVKAWPYIFDEMRNEFVSDSYRYKSQQGKEYFVISSFDGSGKDKEDSPNLRKINITTDWINKTFAGYKKYAINEHKHLPLKGFETNLRIPIEIEQVYVSMRAHIQFCEFDNTVEGKRRFKEKVTREQLSDLDIKGSFQAAQKQGVKDMIILGDPGSGKTTLLKYILVSLIQGKGPEKLGLNSHLVPFFVPLRELKDPAKESFLDFVCRVCCFGTHEVAQEDFKQLLKQKQGIILLDGLDEVADEATRIKTCRWIDEARREYVNTPFVVTSRFAGYLGKSRLEGSVLELTIQDFSPSEVEVFLARWFEAVEVGLHPGDVDEEKWRERGRLEALQLVNDIALSEHVRKLAVNPLMLQIIALVRLDRGTALPERRVELYNECVNVLLEKWDIARGLDTVLGARQSRKLLQPLALWLHGQEGRRSAPFDEIVEQVKKPLESLDKSSIDIGKLLLNIRDRSGIFMGYSESEYGFAHLGFQEYLAAEEIRNTQQVEQLIKNYGNRWWREVTLLALALDNPSIIEPFMNQIMKKEAFKTDIGLVLDAVGDSLIKPYEPFIAVVTDKNQALETRQNALRVLGHMGGEGAIATLKELVTDDNIVLAQAAYVALEMLGAAGGIDKPERRAPAILKIEKDESEMVLIPEGSFFYGSREDDKEALSAEKPQQIITLPSYYIDVYPVTNRQYCRFLNKVMPCKEELEKWIELSGIYEKERCRIQGKGKGYVVERGYEEYPVIYVSWYGAEAYSKWSGKRLPYEVEWEKAARGTEGIKYPWGNEFVNQDVIRKNRVLAKRRRCNLILWVRVRMGVTIWQAMYGNGVRIGLKIITIKRGWDDCTGLKVAAAESFAAAPGVVMHAIVELFIAMASCQASNL